jgi:hypothetical protein
MTRPPNLIEFLRCNVSWLHTKMTSDFMRFLGNMIEDIKYKSH